MNQMNGSLGDKELLTDFISNQKYVTSSYNTFASECVNEQLRNEFLSILSDEHQIQSELFQEASSRGWYPVKPADTNMVTEARQKFTSAF